MILIILYNLCVGFRSKVLTIGNYSSLYYILCYWSHRLNDGVRVFIHVASGKVKIKLANANFLMIFLKFKTSRQKMAKLVCKKVICQLDEILQKLSSMCLAC